MIVLKLLKFPLLCVFTAAVPAALASDFIAVLVSVVFLTGNFGSLTDVLSVLPALILSFLHLLQ